MFTGFKSKYVHSYSGIIHIHSTINGIEKLWTEFIKMLFVDMQTQGNEFYWLNIKFNVELETPPL
jgi:hypothetical protein